MYYSRAILGLDRSANKSKRSININISTILWTLWLLRLYHYSLEFNVFLVKMALHIFKNIFGQQSSTLHRLTSTQPIPSIFLRMP